MVVVKNSRQLECSSITCILGAIFDRELQEIFWGEGSSSIYEPSLPFAGQTLGRGIGHDVLHT
jgi:hypothetical protein